MLTGSSETAKHGSSRLDPPENPIPLIEIEPKKDLVLDRLFLLKYMYRK